MNETGPPAGSGVSGVSSVSDGEIDIARDALRSVVDPEIGLDVLALGLIYGIRKEGSQIVIEMTLTTPGCPVAQSLPEEAANAVAFAIGPGGEDRVEVHVVWDPPWTPDMMEPAARDALGFGAGMDDRPGSPQL